MQTHSPSHALSLSHTHTRLYRLQQVEQDFDRLAETSGKDIHELRQLATEYSQVQKEMAEINTTIQMQKFLTAVLSSDANGNFELDSPQEVDLLVMRLKSIGGIDIDEETLRNSIQNSQSKSLSTIYQVASGTLEAKKHGDEHSGMIEMI